mgnify:FL=1|tara:strand:+ start:1393 stop:1911 length:519 start_codon:yes stop_codon:yes gene_type:complete
MADNITSEQIIEMMKENWPNMYSPTVDLVVYMNRVNEFGIARSRDVLADLNLTLGEFDILAALCRSGKPHVLLPTQLQRSVLCTSGGLTKILHQLESSGLVSRSVRERDKRCKRVHLTPKGKKVAEKAMAAVQEVRDEWLHRAYNKREMVQLKNLLQKGARTLEQPEASQSF